MKKFMFVLAGAVLLAMGSVQTGYASCASYCTICGTYGDDVINGTNGPDVICGNGGNDVVKAKGGDDEVYTEWGNDTIDGGSGDDYIDAGGGKNNVNGGEGWDWIETGYDDDKVDGGDKGDVILDYGSYSDAQQLRGSTGDDYVCTWGGGLVDGGEGFDGCSGGSTQRRCETSCF